ncbi:unnamed protein product [Candidula unifasciata]|uniref:C-type lectin domain-containing protein n=1 Tax=Candidula unifasciata TaxID=100452 RepID=A0A8S3ZEP1_9EUPU|nr:unnamed protein product [Candidula unifasciata]
MASTVIFATILLVVAVNCDVCYRGWEYNEGSCYGFSDTQVSWAEAARVCQIFNGNLAEIDSEEENDFVKEFLQSRGGPEKVWIGATDIFNEGTFEWLSNGGRPLNFTDWQRGQPTDGGSHGQDCLDLIEKNNYTWADDSCTSQYNFICEIPPIEEESFVF